jgi:Txe/YoeB family toxin of Txe-Axe toxin-antitoxin module
MQLNVGSPLDGEHRMVYKIAGDQLWIAQLRLHYRD